MSISFLYFMLYARHYFMIIVRPDRCCPCLWGFRVGDLVCIWSCGLFLRAVLWWRYCDIYGGFSMNFPMIMAEIWFVCWLDVLWGRGENKNRQKCKDTPLLFPDISNSPSLWSFVRLTTKTEQNENRTNNNYYQLIYFMINKTVLSIIKCKM